MTISAETILKVLEKYPPVLTVSIAETVQHELAEQIQSMLSGKFPMYEVLFLHGTGSNYVSISTVFGQMDLPEEVKQNITTWMQETE